MVEQRTPPLDLRAKLAFDQPLRDGIELVRRDGLGTTVVLGCPETHKSLLDVSQPSDNPVTAEQILRAARGDNATVLNLGLDRIDSVNTTLKPDLRIPAHGRGSRHTVALNFAVQTGSAVIVVSQERKTVTLYLGSDEYTLHPREQVRAEVTDTMDALKAIVAQAKRAPSADDPALRSALGKGTELLKSADGHLVELGTYGDALRIQCAGLANALDIAWTPSTVDDWSLEYRPHSLSDGSPPRTLAGLTDAAANVAQPGGETTSRKRRLLIVEDSRTLGPTLVVTLRPEYDCTLVASLEDWEKLTRDGAPQFDGALVDRHLEKGNDNTGMHILEYLRDYTSTPAILMTVDPPPGFVSDVQKKYRVREVYSKFDGGVVEDIKQLASRLFEPLT